MKKLTAFALAVVTSAVAMPALATQMTASGGSISTTGPTDYNTLIGYLAKFNGAAGILDSITLNVGYGFNSAITVTASTASTGNVSTESAAKFDSSDAAVKSALNTYVNTTSAVIGATQLDPAAYDLTGNKSIYNLSAGTSGSYSSSKSATNSYSITDASILSAFIASPMSAIFDVYGSTLTGLNLTASGGNASATQNTIASQSISIIYSYHDVPPADVPEPAMLGLFGMGAIGLGLARRRKV